jgi:ABC-2 type transport system ATP-binding protein
MVSIITARDLRKHFKVYKRHRGAMSALRDFFSREFTLARAVDGVSFDVAPGELIGYLGPNGAGKSTTLKMLTGLLVPSGGELIVGGCVPWKARRSYVATIGAVFGQRTTLWWDLPVIESLELLRHVYKIPPARFARNLNQFRDLLELDPFLNTPARALSLGQRMRADLCAALLHDPALVFLDEPTIGLDVVARQRIRDFIRHINRERGVTILLTTHDLSDVEKLCDRVMIIDHGKLLYDGGLSALTARFGGQRELVVEFAEMYDDVSIPGVVLAGRDGPRATYRFARETVTASELISRLSAQFRITDLSVREPDIEDTVRRIYEERLLEQ